jgi:hypothetical protein
MLDNNGIPSGTSAEPVRMWQVPLCAPTVIGPEVKTENRCRHLAAITHTSTFMQIDAFQFNLCSILVLGYFCMNILKIFF